MISSTMDKLTDGRPRVTITDETRILTVVSLSKKEISIGKFSRFDHSAKGEGCSIYRPMRMVDGTTELMLVNGSMSLMVDLGWISPSELGGFEDLIFDNHGRVGVIGGITVRFGKETDISIFKDANIVKVINPVKSWSKILLSNGKSFDGQPQSSLLELARMGLVDDVNIQALEKLVEAKAVIRQSEEDYKELVLSLGGEFQSCGSYEDFESWYSIPGVPGCW